MNADDHAILIGLKRYPTLGDGGTPADLNGPENDIESLREWLVHPNGGALNPDGSTIHEFRAVDGGAAGFGPSSDKLEADVFGKLVAIAKANANGRMVGRRLYMYLSGHGFSPARQRACLDTCGRRRRGRTRRGRAVLRDARGARSSG